MYRALDQFLSGNNSIWGSIPAFNTAYVAFHDGIAELDVKEEAQRVATKGKSEVKRISREEAAASCYAIRSSLLAFAASSQLNELSAKVNISSSDLNGRSQQEALVSMNVIISSALEHATSLEAFGVSQAMIDDAIEKRDAFMAAMTSPRQGIVERKLLTAEIKVLTKKLDGLLNNQLDQLVEVLKAQAPLFYVKYKNLRMIIDAGSRKPGVERSDGETENRPESDIQAEDGV